MEKYNVHVINFRFRNILCIAAACCSLLVVADTEHLEPVPPCNFNGYSEAVFESLISEKKPRLWMLVLPSFSAEYVVVLDEQIEYEETHSGEWQVKHRELTLKYKAVDEKIRMDRSGGILGGEIAEQCQLVVTEKFADKIEAAWLSVLKHTRYSEKYPFGLDGTTYVFHADRYYGLTWSPEKGSPALLAELGRKLVLLAKSGDAERDRLKAECVELADQIINTK